MQSECFHIVMINHIDAKVEQVLAVAFCRCDERTDVQFQFFENTFVHDTVAVNQMLEE